MSDRVAYRRITLADRQSGQRLGIFYREAGAADAPVLLLLHGFPTSSHMFRGLIDRLADKYRIIAPDLPGFGFSDAPAAAEFGYTFDHLADVMSEFTEALGLTRYALYVFDYGAPVGLRLALLRPDRVSALISQNGNAYEEGLSDGFDPIRAYWRDPSPAHREALRTLLAANTTVFQYHHGAPDPHTTVAPESHTLDQYFLDRPGNDDIQLDLFRDYAANVALYPRFQAYFRNHRPPTLVVWGNKDPFFLPAGAEAFRRDNPDAVIRFVDGGHFPLETHLDDIADIVRAFLARHLDREQGAALFGTRTLADAPPAAQNSLATMREIFGFVPNLGLALAAAPPVLDAYLTMLKALSATNLDPVAQQVAMAAASRANGADYGVAVHATLASRLGAPPAIVAALRHGGALPDAALEAVRRFATAVALHRTQVSDSDVAALRAAGLDAEAAVAVALAVASKTLVNAVAHLARPDIDDGFRGDVEPAVAA